MRLNLFEKFKSIDIFGEPIALNYRGKGSYTTFPGALSTVVTFVLMLFFAVKQVSKFVDKTDPTTSYNEGIINDIEGKLGTKKASEMNFGLGFYL